jgi:3-oxoacyl-(acyl-carrier-protein) synthase
LKRVVITGAGICSPLGCDPDSFFDALIAGQSGIRRIEAPWAGSLSMPYAGTVLRDVEGAFPKLKRTGMDRVAMLALLAARQAVERSGATLGSPSFCGTASERTGIYWSTGMGGAYALESAYQELLVSKAARLRPSSIVMVMNNSATGHIGIDLAIRGPSYTYSSACSSSAVAIGEAFRAIRFGLVDQAIAGGAEALLTLGVIKAWESLGTLAHADARGAETACRPFAGDRTGFLLGEGACALMLEEYQAARARGATVLGEIVGFGNTTDAGHITQPDAGGQARAMRLALAEAGLEADQIDHINAHGTGTKVGDVSETRAIREVFGKRAASVPVSATKALHGHLMGATGAVEMLAATMALQRGVAPPTAHLWQTDPDCDLDYVPLTARAIPQAQIAMSNSFGFGGNNAVLVVRRAPS